MCCSCGQDLRLLHLRGSSRLSVAVAEQAHEHDGADQQRRARDADYDADDDVGRASTQRRPCSSDR
jgi:hypothetical protein